MFSKSTTISLSYLQSVFNAGNSLLLACGNNSANQIDNSATTLWYGTGTLPSYTYRKAWKVPRTSAEGQGATLQEIIAYMLSHSLTSATYRASNQTVNQITHAQTNAHIIAGTAELNDWTEPPY